VNSVVNNAISNEMQTERKDLNRAVLDNLSVTSTVQAVARMVIKCLLVCESCTRERIHVQTHAYYIGG